MNWALLAFGIAVWTSPAPAAHSDFGLAAIQAVVSNHARAEPLPDDGASPARPLREMTLCSLNVVNEDPAKILQVLSAQTGTNLVLLSGSDKKLTLNLKNVKLIDMLRHICALTSLKYLKVGETFVLASAENLKQAYPEEWLEANPPPPAPPVAAKPEIVTSLVMLSHVSSMRIAPILEKFFDKEVVSIVAGPVQDSPDIMAQNTSAKVGTASEVLEKSGDGSLTAKLLIIKGPAELVREAEKLARQLDIARARVVIEVTIYDINDSALREIGASWTLPSINIEESTPNGLKFGTFQRAGMTFGAVIKALERKDQAKVLASPNISVLDGERAFILIGDRITYPVLIGYSQANTPIFSKEEERVGIYLQVAASVNGQGEVTLSLYPQVSTITGFLEVNGASYPQISTREAQSTLRVKSGETLVMGGLLKNEEIRQLEKLPILGDIPFLGELFTRRKTTKSSSQVLISIRPTVLQNDESR